MKTRFIFNDPVLSHYGLDPAITKNMDQTAKHLKICEILSKHIVGCKQEIDVPKFKKIKRGGSKVVTRRKEEEGLEDVKQHKYLKIHGRLEKLENRMTVI